MASATLRLIHWFRQDLRLGDNPAFSAAAESGQVIPVYILDDENAGEHEMGAASRWWLHHSLTALNDSLQGKLSLYTGDAEKIMAKLVKQHKVNAVYWNRCYEPWRVQRDRRIKEQLKQQGIEVASFNGSLLWEPWQVMKKDGTPYRVFTPFYSKGCLESQPPRSPSGKPKKFSLAEVEPSDTTIDKLGLLPRIPWHRSLETHWQQGEKAAQQRLKKFIEKSLSGYKRGRDYPSQLYVSRLSPHLHWGEISPHQVWHAVRGKEAGEDGDHFLSELGWREFSYYLLYHFPSLPTENFQSKFDRFPWRDDQASLAAWQRGETGYPFVDAGMRELWQTGYMHNRVRMVVGSFLVKNLLLHWRQGEAWFWDCLADADLANNSSGWQWVAGCGADAAPYFRVFNPVSQGEKFDPDGEYVRRYVPELAKLPNEYLHKPWQAPEDVLTAAGVKLGKDYPEPIVGLVKSRERALRAFAALKQ